MKEFQLSIKISDGGEMVLHRLSNPKTNITGQPVIIAHGTLFHSDVVRNLAIYLFKPQIALA